MPRPSALFVDDEDSAPAASFQRAIVQAGFEVVRAFSATEAREALEAFAPRIVDLVILDRELPETSGGKPENGVGDGLFREVEAAHPDVPIIVLTGHSDESSVNLALNRINGIDLGEGVQMQRVQHFRKIDNFDFESAIQRIADAYLATESVAVEGFEGDLATRRVIKRAAQYYGGAVVRVSSASGLSDSSVWVCDVVGGDGRARTSVVVKVVSYGQLPPVGGFMASVPNRHTAQPTLTIGGGCSGRVGHVAPLAGASPLSLMEQLASDEAVASDVLKGVSELLANVPAVLSTKRLDDFISPLVSWDRAESIASEYSLELPRPDLPIQTHVGFLHGDLHPGNILIDDGLPVFIDFDRQQDGSLLIDLLALGLGAIFHVDGALRGRLPSLDQLVAVVVGESGGGWLGTAAEASGSRPFGERERWAAALGFALRQLKYPDVTGESQVAELALGLARRASRVLSES